MPALQETVEQHITEHGVTEFIVGHYGDFDGMAAKAVIKAKEKHPEIHLYLLIPYHPAIQPIEAPEGFDGTWYPDGMETVPKRVAIVRANRKAVDEADYLIAYAWHPGNSREVLEYAMRKLPEGHVINLGKQ